MKQITITVDMNGNSLTRSFAYVENRDWSVPVESMIETIEKSKEIKF